MSRDDAEKAAPLDGVKVLEVSQYIAGPYAGQHLADAGAEVIKIERPPFGDPLRSYATGKAPLFGANFLAFNRNKRSVVLDLQSAEGREVFLKLAERADVVLENFRPGVMDRIGLGYETLRQSNPGLIYCGVAGFPADGPDRLRPAFDTVGQALSGILHMLTDPKKPRMRGPSIADQTTGLFAANAIFAALYRRSKTNVGCRIDLTMVDASMSLIPDAFAFHTEVGVDWDSETRAGMSHSMVMRCAGDELLAIHLGGPERWWQLLVQAVQTPELLKDPRFNLREVRIPNWDALLDILQPIFLGRTRAEWMKRLLDLDVPCAEVLTIPEVVANPGVRHAEIFETYDHPVAGPMKLMRRAARIDGSRGPPQKPPALLDEHTDLVLRELGYSDDKVAAMRASGGVGANAQTA